MNKSQLKELENIPLSDKQIRKLVNNKVSVILYPNLVNYKTIEDVLGPYGAAFILFESKPKYGHWVLLFQLDECTLEFFNPYNGFPDDSLNYISINFRKISNQLHTTLSRLMYKSPFCLTYNEFQFQEKNRNIKTCGRHCGFRLMNRFLNLYEYKDLISKLSKKYKTNADGVVTIETAWVTPLKNYN